MKAGRNLLAVVVLGTFAVPIFILTAGNSEAQGSYCAVNTAMVKGEESAGMQLDREQTANARMIVQIVTQKKLANRAAVVAIMTAMQESKLRNIDHGDRDSLGMFQQRPSQGWGTPSQLQDPVYAINAFLFGVPSKGIPGLTDIPDWESMDMAQAAQAVQLSAAPRAYAQWQDMAMQLSLALAGADDSNLGVTCTDLLPPEIGGDATTTAINRAMSQIGVPYVWGGGSPAGPSRGFCSGGNGYLRGTCFAGTHAGFDCSSLMQYAWAPHASLPRVTGPQYQSAGTHIPLSQAKAGDLVFWSKGGDIYHVAMLIAPGKIIEAPRTGKNVAVRNLGQEHDLMQTAVRVKATTSQGS
ncbi:C40 family peptidase [Streptomyces celluloflavus]|uniref:C40 family peptidase n=1 Tax=Streptomyces celluloflavus TaxID=58344 RepID=UPI0036AF54B2